MQSGHQPFFWSHSHLSDVGYLQISKIPDHLDLQPKASLSFSEQSSWYGGYCYTRKLNSGTGPYFLSSHIPGPTWITSHLVQLILFPEELLPECTYSRYHQIWIPHIKCTLCSVKKHSFMGHLVQVLHILVHLKLSQKVSVGTCPVQSPTSVFFHNANLVIHSSVNDSW